MTVLLAAILAACSTDMQDPRSLSPDKTVAQDAIAEKVARLAAEVKAENLRHSIETLVSFETRHVLSTSDAEMRGRGAAQDFMENRMRSFIEGSGGRLTVERHVTPVSARRLGAEIEVVNIVATLRGTTDPDRIYVVGGHYDSRNSRGSDGEGLAPGANDDGSGTAAVIEACRVMSKAEFPATIMFVCYDGEEQGLLGSRAHAQQLAESEATVDGMITNDIVGNTLGMDAVTRDGYLRCFSYAPRGNDSMGRSLARAATRAAGRIQDLEVMLVYRGDRYGRGGDHRPFFDAGYPSLRFTEPREDYSRQHQNVTERDGKPYGDLPEFMDFAYLAKVTQLNISLLSELASAPPPPSVVRVSGARDAHDVRVTWQPVEGVTAYEVVWRLTTNADWESGVLLNEGEFESGENRRSGRVELRTILKDVCVDDVVVGVRCVAEDGSRSRVQAAPDGDSFDRGSQARSGGRRRGR
ncbi:MAG: M28 family metallopeptidase [Planctomycetota bacterium]|jgi:hypothetical protein